MVSSRPAPMYGGFRAPPRADATRSVALALLVLLVPLIGPATSQAAFPGANGKIALHALRDPPSWEIYTMNPDGSSQTRITFNEFDDRFPAWSPDGTKIAFRSARDGNGEIYVMNADGSSQTRLTSNTADDTHPAWSPDGSKIVFTTDRHSAGSPTAYQIYVMDADGSSQTRLTTNSLDDQEPAWSPDGTKIAFTRNPEPLSSEIYTINADGTGETQLDGYGNQHPAWSPDGTKIVFHSCREGTCHETSDEDIFTMSADGSSPTRLTSGAYDDLEPAWSPDGTQIVFKSMRNGAGEIYTMNADGTSQTRLTTHPNPDQSPDWQPVAVAGGYARPAGATPLRVPLVPAYTQCTVANRTHGPPLAFPSCNPPTQESSELTVGTPDANGMGANSAGFAKYRVIVGVPGGVDDADAQFTLQLTDVRHQGTLADYTGELQVASVVRITDRLGGPANEAGTVADFEHRLTVPCAATGGAAGATCSASTTLDALVPGTIKEGMRAIWKLERVQVKDGGPDDLASTTPNTLFAVQGMFVP